MKGAPLPLCSAYFGTAPRATGFVLTLLYRSTAVLPVGSESSVPTTMRTVQLHSSRQGPVPDVLHVDRTQTHTTWRHTSPVISSQFLSIKCYSHAPVHAPAPCAERDSASLAGPTLGPGERALCLLCAPSPPAPGEAMSGMRAPRAARSAPTRAFAIWRPVVHRVEVNPPNRCHL